MVNNMNKETLERLNEIDRQLKELEDVEIAGLPGTGRFSLKNMIENNIKKEEENDMNNLEKLIDNATEEFLNEIEDVDFEIFNEYVKITNEKDGNILDLFKPLTNEGIMLVINTLVRVYVWKIYHDGQLRISANELKNLAIMGITTCEIDPDNKFLQAMIYGLCDGVKGGDR